MRRTLLHWLKKLSDIVFLLFSTHTSITIAYKDQSVHLFYKRTLHNYHIGSIHVLSTGIPFLLGCFLTGSFGCEFDSNFTIFWPLLTISFAYGNLFFFFFIFVSFFFYQINALFKIVSA